MPSPPVPPPPQDRFTLVGGDEYATSQVNVFDTHTGLVVLPTCRTGAAPVRVRIHGEYGMRSIRWSASRKDRPPLLPFQSDIGDTLTPSDLFLGGSVSAMLPTPDPTTGGYTFVTTGEYQFLQAEPRKPGTHAFPCGGYPHPVLPQDTIAGNISASAGVSSSGTWSDAMTLLSPLAQDDTRFPWPFTAIPSNYASTAYFGG